MNNEIELGDLAEDEITKYTGIVIGFTKHITGCDRVLLQSQEIKDGKIPDAYNFDVTTIKVIRKGVVAVPEDRKIHKKKFVPVPRPGGPASKGERL